VGGPQSQTTRRPVLTVRRRSCGAVRSSRGKTRCVAWRRNSHVTSLTGPCTVERHHHDRPDQTSRTTDTTTPTSRPATHDDQMTKLGETDFLPLSYNLRKLTGDTTYGAVHSRVQIQSTLCQWSAVHYVSVLHRFRRIHAWLACMTTGDFEHSFHLVQTMDTDSCRGGSKSKYLGWGKTKKLDDLFSRRPQNTGQNKSTTPTLQKAPPV